MYPEVNTFHPCSASRNFYIMIHTTITVHLIKSVCTLWFALIKARWDIAAVVFWTKTSHSIVMHVMQCLWQFMLNFYDRTGKDPNMHITLIYFKANRSYPRQFKL